jgi:hypothetical protein
MGRRPTDRRAEDDLEGTDELPVLDLGAAGVDDDPLSSTGEWEPLDADAEPARDADDAISALTSVLREKSFAISRLERELEALRDGTGRLQRAGPQDLAELEARLAQVERERLSLAAQHDERRAAFTAAEERLAALSADLAEARAALAAATALAGERTAAAERLAKQLETRTAEVITAELQRDRERLEARIDELLAALESARVGHGVLARDRDEWRSREQERSAEVRALREELRRAGLHAERLLEQLRSHEAQRRQSADVREAGRKRPVAELPMEAAAEPPNGQALATPPAPAPAPMRAVLPKRYLVRLDDPSAPLRVLATERVAVGRTPENDLQVDEHWISRHHAVLRLGPESTIVEDAGSTNGVFVNGRRVRRELLRDGDEVAFGKARFRFQVHRPGATRD